MNGYTEVTGNMTPEQAEVLLFRQAKVARKEEKHNIYNFQKILKDEKVDYLDPYPQRRRKVLGITGSSTIYRCMLLSEMKNHAKAKY